MDHPWSLRAFTSFRDPGAVSAGSARAALVDQVHRESVAGAANIALALAAIVAGTLLARLREQK